MRGCQVEMFFNHLLIVMTIEMLILFMILVGRLNKATYCLLMQLELIPMVAIKVASMNTKICLTENADLIMLNLMLLIATVLRLCNDADADVLSDSPSATNESNFC